MSYDHKAAQKLNETALANPQPGDYWQEMFCPYFVVTAVAGDDITVLSCFGGPNSFSRKNETNAKVDNKDGTWSFDYSKHMVVDREWMRRAVRYESIDGFVADVIRNDKFKTVVKEWKQFNAQRLLTELKALGPEVAELILKAEW
jgi:hypothetical protein